MASRVKGVYKKLTDVLLGSASDVKEAKNWQQRQEEFRGVNPLICPVCKTMMTFISAKYPNSLSFIKAKMDLKFS
jgi:hypothetical protein